MSDSLRDKLRALATPRNIGRLRKIGHGQKRHPETVGLFDTLASVLESLAAEGQDETAEGQPEEGDRCMCGHDADRHDRGSRCIECRCVAPTWFSAAPAPVPGDEAVTLVCPECEHPFDEHGTNGCLDTDRPGERDNLGFCVCMRKCSDLLAGYVSPEAHAAAVREAVRAALLDAARSIEAMRTASQYGPHRRAGMHDAAKRVERLTDER